MQPCLCLCVFQRLCRRDLSVSRRSFARASCVRAHRSVYCAFVRQGVVAASAPGRASVRETGRRAERVGKRGEGGGGVHQERKVPDRLNRSICVSNVLPMHRFFQSISQRISTGFFKVSPTGFQMVSKAFQKGFSLRFQARPPALRRLRCGTDSA